MEYLSLGKGRYDRSGNMGLFPIGRGRSESTAHDFGFKRNAHHPLTRPGERFPAFAPVQQAEADGDSVDFFKTWTGSQL